MRRYRIHRKGRFSLRVFLEYTTFGDEDCSGRFKSSRIEPEVKWQQQQIKNFKLLQRLAIPQTINPEQVLESLSTNISEFCFDPENGTTFEKWFARYTDLFEHSLDDAAKVRLLLRKCGTSSHSRYVNYILPKLPKEVAFAETVKTLVKIFGRQTSVFHKRYQCLQLVKSEADDIITYGGKVNRACEEFEFKVLKIEQFKCLMFVCGLKAHQSETSFPHRSETAESPVTIQILIDEFQRVVNLKSDITMIEQPSSSKNLVPQLKQLMTAMKKMIHRSQIQFQFRFQRL
ncbi:uncharacterized protein K02A2.6-like [Wyeomyia smithii]|uniref:uncharacterized protein K02A2.6-like n=1 Tax=Wyeomyia smithii TaxID=174621 RepID=UPI00246814F3|nr:uncharacterized protein K02A2.6-like [Wyeomyia smithii]